MDEFLQKKKIVNQRKYFPTFDLILYVISTTIFLKSLSAQPQTSKCCSLIFQLKLDYMFIGDQGGLQLYGAIFLEEGDD